MVNFTPPSIGSLLDLQREVTESVQASVQYLAKIDQALLIIDVLLNRFQPMGDGRISIKFISRNGVVVPEARVFRTLRGRNADGLIRRGADGKIRWVSSYTNYKGLTKRVRSTREFEQNHEIVRSICALATTLFDLRKQMVGRLRYAEQSWRNTLSARQENLDDMHRSLMGMLDRIGETDPTVYDELMRVDANQALADPD